MSVDHTIYRKINADKENNCGPCFPFFTPPEGREKCEQCEVFQKIKKDFEILAEKGAESTQKEV